LKPKSTVAAKREIDATLLRIFTIFGWVAQLVAAIQTLWGMAKKRLDPWDKKELKSN